MVKPNDSSFNTSGMAVTQFAQSSSSENSGTNIANTPANLDVWTESEESLLSDDEGLEQAQLPDTDEEVWSDSPSNNGTSMEPSSSDEAECLPEDGLKRIFNEKVSKITNEELLGLKEELARLRKSKLWNTYLLACPTTMFVMHELVRDYDED